MTSDGLHERVTYTELFMFIGLPLIMREIHMKMNTLYLVLIWFFHICPTCYVFFFACSTRWCISLVENLAPNIVSNIYNILMFSFVLMHVTIICNVESKTCTYSHARYTWLSTLHLWTWTKLNSKVLKDNLKSWRVRLLLYQIYVEKTTSFAPCEYIPKKYKTNCLVYL